MKKYFTSTAFVVLFFYVFGALGQAKLFLTDWDKEERQIIFALCGFVCVIMWFGISMNSDKKVHS